MSEKYSDLTETDLLRGIKTAIALKGKDFRYETTAKGCVYREFDDDNGGFKPSCIWGHSLFFNGVFVEGAHEGLTIVAVIEDLNIPASERFKEFANAVQASQDVGRTWGQAVDGPLTEYQEFRALYDSLDVRPEYEAPTEG